MSEWGLLCPGIIKIHSDLDGKGFQQRMRSPFSCLYSLSFLHMTAWLEESQNRTATAHCCRWCFTELWPSSPFVWVGRLAGLPWSTPKKVTFLSRLPMFPAWTFFHCDWAQNSQDESWLDLDKKGKSFYPEYNFQNVFIIWETRSAFSSLLILFFFFLLSLVHFPLKGFIRWLLSVDIYQKDKDE
jgi:hypothetical protein